MSCPSTLVRLGHLDDYQRSITDSSEPEVDEARVRPKDIPKVYDRLARVYDLWAAATESAARKRALSLAHVADGEAVLELAVGTGQVCAAVAAADPNGVVYGVDISRGMLGKARERVSNHRQVLLALTDIRELPFADKSFDLMLASYVFDLLPEPDFREVLEELRRVGRDTSRVVVTNMTIGQHRRHRFYQWLYRRNPKLLGGCRGVLLEPYLTFQGFDVRKREYLTQLGFPTEILVATRRT